jgi:HAD superfamily hydrolase (TIGR01490 family)
VTTEVALFDMDRTLVDIHTARLYLRMQREIGEIGWREALRSSYWLLQYGVGWLEPESVALRLLADYRGRPEEWLRERCRQWFQSHVRVWVSSIGRARVLQHQSAGHQVAIATSAVRQAALPLAAELSIEHLVCSELEVEEQTLTGGFEPPLCYGTGKLERARVLVQSLGCSLDRAVFYTDSITDLPLLEAVGQPVAVNPDPRLRRLARQRGWPIENWRGARPTASATEDPRVGRAQ